MRGQLSRIIFERGNGVRHQGAEVQPAAAHVVSGLYWLFGHEAIIDLAREALGTSEIAFTGHSDVHRGFTPGWHKDGGSPRATDPLRSYFPQEQWADLFSLGTEVVKIAIYMQESTQANCLRVVDGSHRSESMDHSDYRSCLTEPGDLLAFDVRITHSAAPPADPNYAKSRISAFISFGLPGSATKCFGGANMERQLMQLGQHGPLVLPSGLHQRFIDQGVQLI